MALLELEAQIFDVLRGTVESNSLKTVIRVAGGWVRDKLLQRTNHDIDIALDDCSGEAFATLLNEHLSKTGQKTHSVNVIHANPDQSKHLETATVNVLGMQIDCVNLRTEEYASDSRIPTMGFGTAQEDAMRRDFTINAMFFNVNDETVEDLTGHGFADLEAGVIRTPLAPKATLLDDPLRVMRAVRFASRYGFSLAGDLREAMELPEVRAALAGKVSRERVGAELDGMLGSARPVGALRMLEARHLLALVLSPPRMCTRGPVEAAAAAVKAAKGGRGTAKRKAKDAQTAPATALPAAQATALAEWLMTEEPLVEGDEPEDLTRIVSRGMLLVDACDAVLGVIASGGTSSARAGADRALMTPASGSAASGSAASGAPRPVIKGTAIADEDPAREAAILVERASASKLEDQQLRDSFGSSTHLEAKDRRLLLLALLCWPLRDAWTLGSVAKDRGKPAPASTVVLRDRLKLRMKDCADVLCLHEAVPLLLVGVKKAQDAGLVDAAIASALESASSASSSSASSSSASSSSASSAGASAASGLSAAALSAFRLATEGSVLPIQVDLSRAEAAVEAACVAGAATTPQEQANVALGLAVCASKDMFAASTCMAAAIATAVSTQSPTAVAVAADSTAASSAATAAATADADVAARAPRLAALAGAAPGAAAASTAVMALVEALHLTQAAEWKPLVDGKALRGMGVASGPAMRPIMEARRMWRLARPTATADECEAAVRGWVESQ
jgi:hypothetical protein